jgi:hypothetical protein
MIATMQNETQRSNVQEKRKEKGEKKRVRMGNKIEKGIHEELKN